MKKVNLSIFASGIGSNLLALHKASNEKNFPAKLQLIICNKNCIAYDVANKLKYNTKLITNKNINEFEKKVQIHLNNNKIDLICLAGFMRVLSPQFVSLWKNRILNIHPSLLPMFPGLNTHIRVIKSGMKLHGSTVHLVDKNLDSGKILGQFAFEIKNTDQKLLITNLKKYENLFYPEVLKKYIWTFLFKKDNFENKIFSNYKNVVFSY